MKPKIGGSIVFGKHDLETESLILNATDYDFAEVGLGLSIEPNKAFEDKLKTVRNIIPILSVHLPQMDYKKEEIERSKKIIKILSDQGTHVFVIHLYSVNLPTKDHFDLKIKKLRELADFTQSNDSILALENTEEDLMTLKKVFDEIPQINFCLDIGHANLLPDEKYAINLINSFGNLLKHIHIHDNIGGDSEKDDLHLSIGDGKINFKPIFERLKEIKYSGNITIELYNIDKESRKRSIKRARELI
ncbi:MAG: sugar phosphate isomerase/epimerase family protein [Promethearchaeota archaeon]|jgi:sugar phosphate isomerase/epimerase